MGKPRQQASPTAPPCRRWRIGTAALVAAACCGVGHGRTEISRAMTSSQYARVTGPANARQLAQQVAGLVDEAAPRIAPLVGTRNVKPVPVIIYLDRRQFRAATGAVRNSTMVGQAKLPDGVVHVDGTGRLAAVGKVVPHEVGHVMIARALGPAWHALPVWANEGIAEYVAGQRAAQVDSVALKMMGRGRAVRLDRLDASFRAGGKAGAEAYAQAASVVAFLVARQGEQAIASLLAAVREDHSFPAALKQVTGLGLQDLEREWSRSLSRRWAPAMLLTSPALPYGFMALLFLAGLARFLWARRRRLQTAEAD